MMMVMDMKKLVGWNVRKEGKFSVVKGKEEKKVAREVLWWAPALVQTESFEIGGVVYSDEKFYTVIGLNKRKELNEFQKRIVDELRELGFSVEVGYDSCAEGYWVEIYVS